MALKNSDQNYGVVSIALHWGSALLFIGMIFFGIYLEDLPYNPDTAALMDIHKSIGVILMFLILVRLVWRAISPNPPTIETAKGWEQTLSKIVMGVLLASLILFPLSGWVMSNSGGHSVELFGLAMPTIIGESEMLSEISGSMHALLMPITLAAIGLHLAGAMKHHFIYKDTVLKRMWGKA